MNNIPTPDQVATGLASWVREDDEAWAKFIVERIQHEALNAPYADHGKSGTFSFCQSGSVQKTQRIAAILRQRGWKVEALQGSWAMYVREPRKNK